jgi:hypothetical protein
MSGSTVYWGKSSRRWSIKAYCKFCELAEHPPKVDVPGLRDWCENHLRVELTLRRPELKDRDTLDDDVLLEYYEKLTIGGSAMVTNAGSLPEIEASAFCRQTLQIWADGGDPRLSLPRRTFYRHRATILEQVGVDISIARSQQWESMGRAGFDVEFLKSRKVDLPRTEALQRRLFKVA